MDREKRLSKVEKMSSPEILARTRGLAAMEWEAQLDLFFHLIEIEKRRLYLEQGYSSLYDYVMRGLGYSGSSAHRRIATARAVRDFPRVYEGLAARQLNMSTVALLQSVLDVENEAALVGAALGRSQADVEKLVAGHRPAKSVRDRIVPIRMPEGETKKEPEKGQMMSSSTMPAVQPEAGPSRATGLAQEPVSPVRVVPSQDSSSAAEVGCKVVFAAGPEFQAKVEKVRALLSGKMGPGASLGQVMETLVDDFLERESPEKRAERREARAAKRGEEKAIPPTGNPSSRHIPAHVQDQVRIRDGGRCTFVGPDGVRCSATRSLEYHHDEPYGMGGETTVENVRLACRRHNEFMAEQCYGRQAIEAAKKRAERERAWRGRGNGRPSSNSAAELDARRERSPAAADQS